MNENENKNNEQRKDDEVTITLKKSEVFQLNLCVVSRLGVTQCQFANAYCAEEQKSAEALMGYLTALSSKLTEALKK